MKFHLIATAGHVDHGKSSLVKALSGTDPDRLPEEKSRGMTIDLGFASFELEDKESSARLKIGIIDVPGHEDYVHNMIPGLVGARFALFVVAADDGWMPQTEEHLQILEYLRFNKGVIALTKSDLIDSTLSRCEIPAQVAHKCKGTFLESAPVIPCSTRTGSGLGELKSALHRGLKDLAIPTDRTARLYVDRLFQAKGTGLVVAGSLTGGELRLGQDIGLYPNGIKSGIKSMQSYHRKVDRAFPDSRVALQLSGAERFSRTNRKGLRRGDLISADTAVDFSECLDVCLRRLDRDTDHNFLRPPLLKTGVRLRVVLGAGSYACVIRIKEQRSLGEGETIMGQLIAETKVPGFMGQCFVLRDWSGRHTLGGGRILDRGVPWREFKTDRHQVYLKQLLESLDDWKGQIILRLNRFGILPGNRPLPLSDADAGSVESVIESMLQEGKAFQLAGRLIAQGPYQSWCTRVRQLVAQWHREHPESLGIHIHQLQSELRALIPDPEMAVDFFRKMEAHGLVRVGDEVRDQNHQATMPDSLRVAAEKIRQALAAKPFDPPSIKHLVTGETERHALRFLIESGECSMVGSDSVTASWALKRMRKMIVRYLKQNNRARVSEIKSFIGTNRRLLIPILEAMDAEGVLVREGDFRSLPEP